MDDLEFKPSCCLFALLKTEFVEMHMVLLLSKGWYQAIGKGDIYLMILEFAPYMQDFVGNKILCLLIFVVSCV